MQARSLPILVIDREPELNEVLRTILTDSGYNAIAAPNLDAAIHLLGSIKLSLVITNYMESSYSRDDRWPVLEMFKALVDPGTPFIVLSTNPKALSQTAQQLGVADVIAKPFDLDDLLRRVAQAIAGRQGGR